MYFEYAVWARSVGGHCWWCSDHMRPQPVFRECGRLPGKIGDWATWVWVKKESCHPDTEWVGAAVWRLVVVGGDSSYSRAVPIRLAGTRAVWAQWWWPVTTEQCHRNWLLTRRWPGGEDPAELQPINWGSRQIADTGDMPGHSFLCSVIWCHNDTNYGPLLWLLSQDSVLHVINS